MVTLMAATFDKDAALVVIKARPGISDRELAEVAFGIGAGGQSVNAICRQLVTDGHTRRRLREDGLFGNYPVDPAAEIRDGRAAEQAPGRTEQAGE
jgi:hypothetical protein